MKKVLLSFFFFYAFFSMQAASLLYRQGFDASQAQGKQACFAWDLNDVVFKKQIRPYKLIKHIHNEQGLSQTPKLIYKFLKLWAKKRQLKKQNDSKGFSWDAMLAEEAQTNPERAQFFRSLALQVNVLDVDMVKVMHQLSNNRHKHGILSNMGQHMLQVQIDNLKTQTTYNPQLKSFFLTFLEDTHSNIVSSEENNWISKPHKDMYQLFLQKNKNRGEITIFIDDKLENIKAALANGFDVGIHYPHGSTSAQLKKLLHKELKLAH